MLGVLCGGGPGLKQTWQRWASDHVEYQTKNPFSDTKLPNAEHLDIHSPEYGLPKQGSRTEQRGKDAHTHVGKEVEELCLVIKNIGVRGDDGHTRVTFGKLFEAYVKISNKLVGVLLRGRKHGLLQFDGEMLWQGKDDHVIITLIN
uniref:Actin-binding Rho-activating protein n=1 Tax=Leptobrachium leishanense TaxID=445787 RepID=A0A8C5MKJ0_9ANUR